MILLRSLIYTPTWRWKQRVAAFLLAVVTAPLQSQRQLVVLLAFLLAFPSVTFAQTKAASVKLSGVKLGISGDCGTGNDLLCGNVGDPYEGAAPPTMTDSVAACGTLTGNNKVWRLQNNVTASGGSANNCFTVSGSNSILDLNGKTVNGTIMNSSGNVFDGIVIMNGTILCSGTDASLFNTCLYIQQPGGGPDNVTQQIRIHHLTVRNTLVLPSALLPPGTGKRAIYVDWGGTGTGIAGPDLRFDHITSDAYDGVGASRVYVIGVVSSHDATMDHNKFTCGWNSGPCQTALFYGTDNGIYKNNLLTNEAVLEMDTAYHTWVTNVQRTSGSATVTVGGTMPSVGASGLAVGNPLHIAFVVADTSFNGTWLITSWNVGAKTISFAQTGLGDVASTPTGATSTADETTKGQFTFQQDDTARAMMWDGGADNGSGFDNHIVANNTRGLRIRDSIGTNVYRNTFDQVTKPAPGGTGTVHLGDPDSGLFTMTGCNIHDNTYNLAGNNVQLVWTRSAQGCTIQNETVNPNGFTTGYFGHLVNTAAGSTLTFKNNTLNGSLTGSPGINVWVESNTTAHVCSSGVAGAGPSGGSGTWDASCP